MPSTRRSSGFLNNGLESPGTRGGPSIEHFLELLEQFKRKHVAQNREIIKTNAMQAIRIRDLEQRIQQLERLRCEEQMDICRLQRELDEASRNKGNQARMMWWEMGRQMGFVEEQPQPPRLHQLFTTPQLSAPSQSLPAYLAPSRHLKLDPNALPGGVARSIARPPTLGIDQITEDEEQEDERPMHAHTTIPMQEHEYPFSLAPSTGLSGAAHSEPPPAALSRVTKRDTMRGKRVQSTSSSGIQTARPASPSPPRSPSPPLQDAEMLELETDADGEPGALRLTNLTLQSPSASHAAPSASVAASAQTLDSSSHSSSPSSPAVSRKRKTTSPTPPAKQRDRDRDRTPLMDGDGDEGTEDRHRESSPVEDAADDDVAESQLGSRTSRRSSVRARASVNYALPKLNTKMRKPDPEDLKPAKTPRVRANGSSITSSNGDLKDLKKQRQRSTSVEATPKKRAARGRSVDEQQPRGTDEHVKKEEEQQQQHLHPFRNSSGTRSSHEIDDDGDGDVEDETITPSTHATAPATAPPGPYPTSSGESLSELFHVHRDNRDTFLAHRGGPIDHGSRDTTDDEHEETSASEMEEVLMDEAEERGDDEEEDGDETVSPTPTPPPPSTNAPTSAVLRLTSSAQGADTSTSTARRRMGGGHERTSSSSSSSKSRDTITSSRLTSSTAASRSRSAANEGASSASASAARRRSASASSRPSSSAPPSSTSSSSTASSTTNSPAALLTSLGLPTTDFVFKTQGKATANGGGGGGEYSTGAGSTAAGASSNSTRKVAALRKLSVNGSVAAPRLKGSATGGKTTTAATPTHSARARSLSTTENVEPGT